jgi:hypothetical protein
MTQRFTSILALSGVLFLSLSVAAVQSGADPAPVAAPTPLIRASAVAFGPAQVVPAVRPGRPVAA